VHFLAMEFVEGESLAARIARGPLPPRTAARIARQLLQGLGAAHAADVLHLDFKSQNVMLRAGMLRTEAVIMDFSLSRVLEAGARRGARERHALGSPGYMSPERLEGRTALGPASDLYSFGVVLFEMLTGRLPFPNEPAKALMALRLAQPTPLPSHALPGLTTAFDAFVAKCLARHPAYRFPDAESALAALDGCLSRPLGRPKRWWRRLGRARRSG
jgi:serine/threonine protein kinase